MGRDIEWFEGSFRAAASPFPPSRCTCYTYRAACDSGCSWKWCTRDLTLWPQFCPYTLRELLLTYAHMQHSYLYQHHFSLQNWRKLFVAIRLNVQRIWNAHRPDIWIGRCWKFHTLQ